jgi:hypothetical protein
LIILKSQFFKIRRSPLTAALTEQRVALHKHNKLLFPTLVINISNYEIAGRKSVIAGYCYFLTQPPAIIISEVWYPVSRDDVQTTNGEDRSYLFLMTMVRRDEGKVSQLKIITITKNCPTSLVFCTDERKVTKNSTKNLVRA